MAENFQRRGGRSEGTEMGRGGHRRWPQRPNRRRVPGPRWPLGRRARAASRHWRSRCDGGADPWLQVLPLQLSPEPSATCRHQVGLSMSRAYLML